MHVAHNRLESLKHEFTVKIPAEQVDLAVADRLKVIGQKAKIPGFRPGKAPESILRQRYGAAALEEALEDSINKSIRSIFSEHKIRQAFQPNVDIKTFEAGKDLEFTITVESLPEIDIKPFDSISLEKMAVTVEAEEVEKRLNDLVKNHKKFVAPAKERAAKKNDLVTFTMTATVDGKPFDKLGKEGSIEIGHDKNVHYKNLDKGLVGAKLNQELTITDTLPADFTDQAFAGKEIVFNITVTKIEEPVTFELNDDFAKELRFETVEDLRKQIEDSIKSEYQRLSRLHVKRFLLDKLSEDYKFDLPPTLVQSEFDAIWNRLKAEMEQAKKEGTLDEEDKNKSEEELQKEYKAIAERRVRLGLLISEIAKLNKIQPTEQELRMAIFQEAMNYPNQMEQVFEFYRKNSRALDHLAAPILEDKVVDFILAGAKVTEKAVSSDEFKKAVKGVIPTPFDDESEEEIASSEAKQKTKKSKGKVA